MSHAVSTWAWKQKLDPRQKLVLVKLADSANDDGVCWPSLRTLEPHLGMSKSAIDRALKKLVEAGLLVVEQRQRENGTRRSNYYRLQVPWALSHSGGTTGEGGLSHSGGTPLSHPGGTLEPSLEPSVKKEASPPRKPGTALATIGAAAAPAVAVPEKVDRKPVTEEEAALAVAVLAAWNWRTDQRLTSKDWVAKIVMRIREHPEIDDVGHKAVIEATLAQPWWTGPPTPSVVYGSGAQFERCLLVLNQGPRAERRGPGGSASADELLRRAVEMQREEDAA